MSSTAKKSKIYESIEMLHPDGSIICHTSSKRANWYVSKKLAQWVTPNKTFILTFNPSGRGRADNPYFTQKLDNLCVVCGTNENLNKHHVVPYMFRKHFPTEKKNSNHHDILPICIDCHEKYESQAMQFKLELAKKFGVAISQKQSNIKKNNNKIIKARTLIDNINSGKVLNIPANRIAELKLIADKQLEQEPQKAVVHWGQTIISKTISISFFETMWRQHFISIMNPQFLPKHWSINGS